MRITRNDAVKIYVWLACLFISTIGAKADTCGENYTESISRQAIRTKAAFKYGFIVNLDKNGVATQKLDVGGIILIAEESGQEAISITIGEKEMYSAYVYSKKNEYVDANTKLTVYLAIQEFNGHKVPLQIFEEYDLRKSDFIPDSYTVMICSEQTGETIQGQSFHNVSRVR